MHSLLSKYTVATVALAVSFGMASPLPAQPAAGTQPAADAAPQAAPATRPAAPKLVALDPRVQKTFEQAREAYKAVKSYQDLGTVTETVVIHGRRQEQTRSASTTFSQPGKFMANLQAMNLYSNGQTLWIYLASRSRYLEAPAEQVLGENGEAAFGRLLQSVPALSMLLQPDKSLLATREVISSQHRGQAQVGDRTAEQITLVSPASEWYGPTTSEQADANKVQVDLFFDTQTHMLVRMNLDLTAATRAYLERAGQGSGREVSQVTWQFNAGKVRLNTPVPEETFVFKVPAEAEQAETYTALLSGQGRAPINDEEEAERREAEEAKMPYAAPDFTLPDLAGKPVKLSDLKGKVVLLDFWATWCGPCRAAMPHLQKLHEEFGEKGLVVLGVDIGEDAETVRDFVENNKLTFKMVLDEEDAVSRQYKITAIPRTLLIDRRGQVVKAYTGFGPGQEKQLQRDIEEALNATATTQPAATQAASTQAAEE